MISNSPKAMTARQKARMGVSHFPGRPISYGFKMLMLHGNNRKRKTMRESLKVMKAPAARLEGVELLSITIAGP